MKIKRPEFAPDPALSRNEMKELQREIASTATFSTEVSSCKTICGIDQAFFDGQAISAAIVMQDGEIIEQQTAVEPAHIPYIPGLLAFREGGPIISVLKKLTTSPDCLLFDGSGRIHFREAGLATHIGVIFDMPAVGVTKNLLCGTPKQSVDSLSSGEMVPIKAGDDMIVDTEDIVGYAVQTRTFDSSNRHVNPVYVSPGHKTGARQAATITLDACHQYKLPEPIRQADSVVSSIAAERRE